MDFRKLNLELTKKDLISSFTKDTLIIQVIHSIDLIDSSTSKLVANIRDRYSYYNLRSSKIQNQEDFLNEMKKREKDDLAVNLSKKDLDSIYEIFKEIEILDKLKESHVDYLDELMKEMCPNTLNVSGIIIGAKLIDLAGSLKNLAEMPSSKIQVLGAEKALFRHLIKKAKAPKFGVIFHHESISKAENKGKAARQLAAKISIASKKDYFRNK